MSLSSERYLANTAPLAGEVDAKAPQRRISFRDKRRTTQFNFQPPFADLLTSVADCDRVLQQQERQQQRRGSNAGLGGDAGATPHDERSGKLCADAGSLTDGDDVDSISADDAIVKWVQ